MAVGMREKWKIPVSYHLTRGLTADQQKTLIICAIDALQEQNIQVRVVTFDGAATNVATAKKLGCNYEADQYSFQYEGRHIFVTLDACHMLKVLRNCLGDMYMLRTQDGVVCWEYIKQLVQVQEMGELHMANKITKRHIYYKEQIMKVKLAAQVFSQSTADALVTLCGCDIYPEFLGVGPTVTFLKVSVDMFKFYS